VIVGGFRRDIHIADVVAVVENCLRLPRCAISLPQHKRDWHAQSAARMMIASVEGLPSPGAT
jgi:DNA-binding IscR family transcriptional regulator